MSEIKKRFYPDRYEATYRVMEAQHNWRLDSFMMKYWPTLSRQALKRKISKAEITIEGREKPFPHRPSTKVWEGDIVKFVTHKTIHEDEYWRGEKIELEWDFPIVYEDEHIAAISKPPYMSTHPTGRHLFFCATVLTEQIFGKPTHSIHRLDRETSGILLIGKHPKASQKISDEFENRRVKKVYLFIGRKKKSVSFPIRATERLGQKNDSDYRMYMYCFPENSFDGKASETLFESVFEDDDYVVGLAYPKTGRQHQIRAHACQHGFPLLGDKLYDGGIPMFQRFKDLVASEEDHNQMQIPRQALHAIAISFDYYIKNESLELISPFPNDFKDWINRHLKANVSDLEICVNERIKTYFQKN